MVAQPYEHTKNHRMVSFKRVNGMGCDFCLNLKVYFQNDVRIPSQGVEGFSYTQQSSNAGREGRVKPQGKPHLDYLLPSGT